MPFVARAAFAAIAVMCTLGISSAAYAACTNPAGAEGELIYNDDHNIMQFCDNTNWIGMSGGSGGGGGGGVTDGDKGDVTVSGSGATWMLDDDVLDFTELSDTLTLDASTKITVTGSNVLTITNTGTGNSLVVEDAASTDATPFVIDAAGQVGIGIGTPTQALDVAGKATASSVIYKAVTSTAAPVTGSSMWSTNGTDVWRTSGMLGLGTATPSNDFHMVKDGSNSLRIDTYGNSSVSPSVNMRHADGTFASQANTKSGFSLGNITWAGNGATGNFAGSAAKIHAQAAENWTDATAAASIVFSTRGPNDTGSSNERMRIAPDGKVGIGTSTPATTLDVGGIIHGSGFSTGGVGISLPSDIWNPQDVMGLGSSGSSSRNQGIIGHQGSHELNLFWNFYRNAGSTYTSLAANGYTSANGIRMGNAGIQFAGIDTMGTAMPATRMTILNGGNVGIGTTAPARALEVDNATPLIRLTDTVSGASTVAYIEIMGADGNRTGYVGDGSTGNTNIHIASDSGSISAMAGANACTYTSGASWSCSSDARLKKNIEPVSDSLVKLAKLRSVTFEWIDPNKQDGRHYGFIAQDVEKVYPEMVSEGEDGMKQVDYSAFISPVIDAVQQLNAKNISLEAKVDDLTKRLEALEAKQ